jgi:hypothetical protein
MPLIEAQEIIVITTLGKPVQAAVAELRAQLEAFPPCRIISIAFKAAGGLGGTDLIAVVETI